MAPTEPARRNLVVVRAGDQSLHPRWLAGATTRSWDLLVNYFGDDPARYRVDDVMRIDSKGPKWRALKQLIESHGDLFHRYDQIWFPDDDIDCTCRDIEVLFRYARERNLELCQPSLTHDSYVAVWITSQNPLTIMRYTNYVENMVPCFSQSALFACLPSMDENISGWGIDHLWGALRGHQPDRTAIIDCVAVKHTRPIADPSSPTSNYAFMKDSGKTPRQEANELMARHGIGAPEFRIESLVFPFGVQVPAQSRLGLAILRLSYRIMIKNAYLRRNPMRWELDSIMNGRMAQPHSSFGP